jgi:hypothetical protein
MQNNNNGMWLSAAPCVQALQGLRLIIIKPKAHTKPQP